MNRLEKLKNRLAEKHYKESGHVPTEWAVMNFNSGFDAASAEYEKIIAELEGALLDCELELLTIDDHVNYGKMERYYSPERSQQLGKLILKAQSALKKLKDFRE